MALGSSRSSLPAFSSLGPRAASRVACCIRAQAVGTVEEDIRFACFLDAGSQGPGLGSGMSWREEQELRGLGPALGDDKSLPRPLWLRNIGFVCLVLPVPCSLFTRISRVLEVELKKFCFELSLLSNSPVL